MDATSLQTSNSNTHDDKPLVVYNEDLSDCKDGEEVVGWQLCDESNSVDLHRLVSPFLQPTPLAASDLLSR
jgi:hypothetical protein